MKPLLILVGLLISTYGWSNLDSKEPITLNLAEGLVVEYYEVEANRIFRAVFFNEDNHALHFQTNNKINMVQIYDEDGAIKFQLPVESKHMVFKKNLLSEGQYKIGFILQNDPTVHFTKITSK